MRFYSSNNAMTWRQIAKIGLSAKKTISICVRNIATIVELVKCSHVFPFLVFSFLTSLVFLVTEYLSFFLL